MTVAHPLGTDERQLPQILGVYREIDTSWRTEAACKDTDPDLWFPTRFTTSEDIATAKAICAGCPVESMCLAYALDTGQRHGLWGGRTERERRRLKKVLRPYGRRSA